MSSAVTTSHRSTTPPIPTSTTCRGMIRAWCGENRAWWEPLKAEEYRAYYALQYDERLA